MKHILNKTDRKENFQEISNFLDRNGLSKIKGGTFYCGRCWFCIANKLPLPYAESTYVRSAYNDEIAAPESCGG